MFRLYRQLNRGEFIVGFGDTAQGGDDKNFSQFMSKTQADIPLVYSRYGVAAESTPYIHQALEWIFDKTGVRPVFAFERQNGGASEMHNLMMMNRSNKYILYQMKQGGGLNDDEFKPKWGWDTNVVTRPTMIGEWKVAFEARQIGVYDQETLDDHQSFVTNKQGKPEAAVGTHDDGVMSCAGAFQLYQTEQPSESEEQVYTTGSFTTAW